MWNDELAIVSAAVRNTTKKVINSGKNAIEYLAKDNTGMVNLDAFKKSSIVASELSTSKIEHVLKNHTFGRMEQTIGHLMKKGLRKTAEDLLNSKSFLTLNGQKRK